MAKAWRAIGARPWVVVLLVLVLMGATGGGVWWFTGRDATAAAATAGPVLTTTETDVTTGTITKSISASGTLAPAVDEQVSFGASGKVTAVNVAVGDTVTTGQALGTIDTVELNQSLASAKATLASANAKVAADQTSITDTQTSITDDQTAVADAADTDDDGVDDAVAAAALASDQSQLATLQAQLVADQASAATASAAADSANADLADATLVAPVDGVIAAVNVSVGDQVTGSGGSSGSGSSAPSGSAGSSGSGSNSSSGSSTTGAFEIVGTASWKTSVSVDDAQVNLIKPGIQAQITVSGSTTPLFGKVSSVGVISTSSSGTASYPVEVDITGTPTGLHDGSSATVELIYMQLNNVLVVPTTAVHTENGGSVVYQMKDGKQVSTPVTAGESSGTSTEIKSGLSEGDKVLVTSISRGSGSTGTGTGTGTGTRGTGTGTGEGLQNFINSGQLPPGFTLPTGAFPGGAGGGTGSRSGG